MYENLRLLSIQFSWMPTSKQWLLQWHDGPSALIPQGEWRYVDVHEPLDGIARLRILEAVSQEMSAWLPMGNMLPRLRD